MWRILFLCWAFTFLGQTTSKDTLIFQGYAEGYVAQSWPNSSENLLPSFAYNHKQLEIPNFNLVMGKAQYVNSNFKASLGFMAGVYPRFNLEDEPEWARYIYEANVGVRLHNAQNLWLEAGVFASHIGFESALSADCLTLTRSILAENSPYYESGVKVTYTAPNDQYYLTFLILNGWQNIGLPQRLQTPSIGVQFFYRWNEKVQVNYSNFIGSASLDVKEWHRFFNNFYVLYQPSKKWQYVFGFDIGFEHKRHLWFSPVVVAKHHFTSKWATALRAEYYADPDQVIIPTGMNDGFRTFSFSSNWDYALSSKWLTRVEARWFGAKTPVLGSQQPNLFLLMCGMSYKLN